MRTSHATQLLALLVVSTLAVASAQNITEVIMMYPQFSTFAKLMVETGVVKEVQSRSSITVLLPANDILDPYVAEHPDFSTQEVSDVLRYHVLLQYFGGAELATLSSEGYTVTTLYQTTGRANDLNGFLNLTKTASGVVTVGPAAPMAPATANVITNVTQYPYNYSFVQISAVLQPLGLMASPPVGEPVMAPMMSPMESPMMAPMMSPMESPMMAPMEAPAEGPMTAGPAMSKLSTGGASSLAVGVFNAVAVMTTFAVAAVLL